MAKKPTKAWPAVQQFLSEKTTDNFLEILVAIKKGNLVEADRKSLSGWLSHRKPAHISMSGGSYLLKILVLLRML